LIPDRAELEPHYESWELDAIDKIRKLTDANPDDEARNTYGRRALRALWPDDLVYLSKTSWISTKSEGLVLLKPNYAQQRFYEDVILRCRREGRPIRGTILKARQLGFSTFIQVWQFMQCDLNAHRRALTLSYDDPSTVELHEKSKTVYANQWFPRKAKRNKGELLEFEKPHSSIVYTRTAGTEAAGRSLTVHHQHQSEIPMWPDPEGTSLSAQQAVPAHASTSIFKESTAKGAHGKFYNDWNEAVAGESDYVPFFAPWYWDPTYTLPFPSDDHKRAFMDKLTPEERDIRARHSLTAEQMAWRAWKIRNDCSGSLALWNQEYPTEPSDAFLSTGSPVFNARAVRRLQDNIASPRWIGDIFLTEAPK